MAEKCASDNFRQLEDPLKILAKRCLRDFKVENGMFSGYIDGSEEFDAFMTNIRVCGFHYAVRTSHSLAQRQISGKVKGETTFFFHYKNSDISVPFLGWPFQQEKTTYFVCPHGNDYKKRNDDKTENFEPVLEQPSPLRKRTLIQPTKKIGCQARMVVKCIRMFPDYVISETSNWKRKKKLINILKEDMKRFGTVRSISRHYVCMSQSSEHSHTVTAAKMSGRLHPSLVGEIHRLVSQGVCSVKGVKLFLQQFVDGMFPDPKTKPDVMNSTFYPTNKTIYSHVYDALSQLKKDGRCVCDKEEKKRRTDEDSLGMAVNRWASASLGNFFFHLGEDELEHQKSSSVLFCHQAKWQQDILARYGDHICVFDAVHRTIKFGHPLYFILVKTNVSYSVVGTMVLQSESKECLVEGLQLLLSWNPSWCPKYFIADCVEMEICAIEEVFPHAKVYYSSFHRDQAWLSLFSKEVSVPTVAEDLKKKLQAICDSRTEAEYHENLRILCDSGSWKTCESLSDHFLTQWLTVPHRWVCAFYEEEFFVNVKINNGIDDQGRVLKYVTLKQHSSEPLVEMLSVIVEEYLPDQCRKYFHENGASGFKAYRKDIPLYLHDRPQRFVKHMLSRLSAAEVEYDGGKIVSMSEGVFIVRSEMCDNAWYVVSFSPVSCSCVDFVKWVFPCKHFCAVFVHVPGWSFDKLPKEYTDSIFLTADTNFCSSSNGVYGEENSSDSGHFEDDTSSECSDARDFITEIVVFDSPTPQENEVEMCQGLLREKLEEAVNFTYTCDSVDALQAAASLVNQVTETLKPMSQDA